MGVNGAVSFCPDAVKGMLLPIYLLKCKNLGLLDSGSANDKLIEEEERGTYKDIVAHGCTARRVEGYGTCN